MRIRPLFKWYDLWIGMFIDTSKSLIYVLPLPCIGVVIDVGPHCDYCNNWRTVRREGRYGSEYTEVCPKCRAETIGGVK